MFSFNLSERFSLNASVGHPEAKKEKKIHGKKNEKGKDSRNGICRAYFPPVRLSPVTLRTLLESWFGYATNEVVKSRD